MNRRWMPFATAAAALATALTAPLGAMADDKTPLKIVVGFPPGGSADTLARLIADGLAGRLRAA